MLSYHRLKEVINYNPDTGEFIWLPRIISDSQDPAKVAAWNTRYAGKRAGVHTHGYIKISIDDQKHYAHRLAWFFVFGKMPKLIDHINRDGTDNRIANLREATRRINVDNSFRKDNTSGVRGVVRSANGKKFIAQRKNGNSTNYYLGTFETIEEAEKAYLKACSDIE